MARCVGIKRDLRLDSQDTYANYPHLNFKSYLGSHGDSYDRFLLRMMEMVESLNIINQCLYKLGSTKKKKKTPHIKLTKTLTHIIYYIT